MDNILIPLNDERLPIPNCITLEMMEVLLTNPRFEEFYSNIKEHPEYKNFTKKIKKQQKKVLEPLMSSNLSEYLDKEVARNNKRSKKNSLSIRSSTITPRTIKTGLKTTNINSLAPYTAYTAYTPFSTLVSARGGALGTVIDFARALGCILFVLYLFNPNLFMNRLISSSLRELLNVSTDKNSERLVYLLVTRVDNYFVKIAPCRNNLTKKYFKDNSNRYIGGLTDSTLTTLLNTHVRNNDTYKINNNIPSDIRNLMQELRQNTQMEDTVAEYYKKIGTLTIALFIFGFYLIFHRIYEQTDMFRQSIALIMMVLMVFVGFLGWFFKELWL